MSARFKPAYLGETEQGFWAEVEEQLTAMGRPSHRTQARMTREQTSAELKATEAAMRSNDTADQFLKVFEAHHPGLFNAMVEAIERDHELAARTLLSAIKGVK